MHTDEKAAAAAAVTYNIIKFVLRASPLPPPTTTFTNNIFDHSL
jgi:hypothetical protein